MKWGLILFTDEDVVCILLMTDKCFFQFKTHQTHDTLEVSSSYVVVPSVLSQLFWRLQHCTTDFTYLFFGFTVILGILQMYMASVICRSSLSCKYFAAILANAWQTFYKRFLTFDSMRSFLVLSHRCLTCINTFATQFTNHKIRVIWQL